MHFYVLCFAGFIADQKEYEIKVNNKTHPYTPVGPGQPEPTERFRLNNLSFAGPVIMGVGGKMLFSLEFHGTHGPDIIMKQNMHDLCRKCKVDKP